MTRPVDFRLANQDYVLLEAADCVVEIEHLVLNFRPLNPLRCVRDHAWLDVPDHLAGLKLAASCTLNRGFEVPVHKQVLLGTFPLSSQVVDISGLELLSVDDLELLVVNKDGQDRVGHEVNLIDDLV